jgi:hypothetical protein
LSEHVLGAGASLILQSLQKSIHDAIWGCIKITPYIPIIIPCSWFPPLNLPNWRHIPIPIPGIILAHVSRSVSLLRKYQLGWVGPWLHHRSRFIWRWFVKKSRRKPRFRPPKNGGVRFQCVQVWDRGKQEKILKIWLEHRHRSFFAFFGKPTFEVERKHQTSGTRYGYPLVILHLFWTWPFIVDFPIKNGDVP